MPKRLPLAMLAAIVVSLAAASGAAAQVKPYGTADGGGFRSILPSGQNGLTNTFDLVAFNANGTRPPHSNDQLAMYGDLVYASPGLTPEQVPSFFKDATFGIKDGDVERTYSPRNDVTIQRDKGFGVPHIYGSTRQGSMFGAGYVAGEDRLFFIDALRHVGRSELSSFAGGGEGNRKMDRAIWIDTPYTEADLQRQVDQLDDLYGAEGAQVQNDIRNYTQGVNAYIDEALADPTLRKLPAEYAAIGRSPEEWKDTDAIAIAALVGGIFGAGGGKELDSALFLQSLTKRLGRTRGTRAWRDFRSAEDPEAPTTVHKKRFPYQVQPRRVKRGAVALPDSGSVKKAEAVPGASGGGASASSGGLGQTLGDLLKFPNAGSNALTVSARESKSGRPLAVFGPQTGYFNPQILMESEIHSPAVGGDAIDAAGAAFPGVNLYIQLGRGRDYSWSATSAGQDNIDTFALELCEPDGKAPTTASKHYRFRGQCKPIEQLTKTNTWTPSAADQTPPGSETLRAERTDMGIVSARATVKGKPVIYTSLRSTYFHEVDSALGFVDFNNPDKITGPREYQRAAHKIGYTFNWLYVDDKDIAYFNSGNNPVRARGVDQSLPLRGEKRFEWKNFNPASLTAAYTPFSQHPQVLNQRFITSWNNKQAPGYRASDANFAYQSTYRVQPLDDRIRRGIKGSRKMSLVELIDAMEDSGTVDHRGDKVLPWLLRVIGKQKDAKLRDAVAKLKAWNRSGAHRRDKDRTGTYDDAEAVRIMDAWWPLLIDAQFKPVLGEDAYKRLQGLIDNDNEPNNAGGHLGSAYNGGWYGYVQKDLRNVLKRRVKGRYSRRYCGKGNLKRCRTALAGSLAKALEANPADVYKRDSVCSGVGKDLEAQYCFDTVRQSPIGAVTQPLIHWINRPTFQQVVEIQGRVPRGG